MEEEKEETQHVTKTANEILLNDIEGIVCEETRWLRMAIL
jgi:hypothetical protein